MSEYTIYKCPACSAVYPEKAAHACSDAGPINAARAAEIVRDSPIIRSLAEEVARLAVSLGRIDGSMAGRVFAVVEPKKYPCGTCDFATNNYFAYHAHVIAGCLGRPIKAEPKRWTCLYCAYSTNTEALFEAHSCQGREEQRLRNKIADLEKRCASEPKLTPAGERYRERLEHAQEIAALKNALKLEEARVQDWRNSREAIARSLAEANKALDEIAAAHDQGLLSNPVYAVLKRTGRLK